MKKLLKTMLVTSTIMVAALGAGSYYLMKQGNEIKTAEKEEELLELDVDDGKKKPVYEERTIIKIPLDTSEKQLKDVYFGNYTESQNKFIKKKKKKNIYNFESPLWIWDCYGTNHLSLYTYFKTTENCYLRYTVQVDDNNIPNFTRKVRVGDDVSNTREHEYQLTGFVPGMRNILVMEIYSEEDEILDKKVYSVQVPKLSSGADTKISMTSGRSEEKMSNGFYVVYGKKDIWLYDNSGVLRGEIPLVKRATQNLIVEESKMYYGIDSNHFVKISSDGAVEHVYSIGKYEQYGQWMYNGYGSMWIMATEPGKKNKSIRDTILAVDLENSSVTKLFSMDQFMPDVVKKAKIGKNKKLNWIDLNSIAQVNSDEMLVSSRELSTIFKVIHITSRSPRISFLIGEEKTWKKTSMEKRLLDKTGQEEADAKQAEDQANSVLDLGAAAEVFLAPFGQSYIEVEKSSALTEGQYYLYVWDSNYGYSSTRPDLKWSRYDGVGTKKFDARLSYVKKFLVDETLAQYNIDSSQDVVYTKENGNMQYYDNHRIDSYGNAKSYAEYDKTGKMIRKFSYEISDVTHVEKQNLKNIWYQ